MNTLKKYSIVLGLLFLSSITFAQITFPDNVNDEAPAAPIDGFIVVGIAVGGYLALRKKTNEQ